MESEYLKFKWLHHFQVCVVIAFKKRRFGIFILKDSKLLSLTCKFTRLRHPVGCQDVLSIVLSNSTF